jgi:hypothetical protein
LPPKVLPCWPGGEHARYFPGGHHRRQRHDPTTERLAQHVDVGLDILVLAGEGPPGPARPRLDLVGDQQDAGLGADVADLAQVSRRRDDHAGLALDGLTRKATVSSSIASRRASASPKLMTWNPGAWGP